MNSVRAGLPLVKKFEQCRLQAFKPIPTDPFTIGWGRTAGVQEGDTCTQDEADQWLLDDYDTAQEEVLKAIHVDLSDNQIGALTSFVYNVGPGHEGHKDGLVHLKAGGSSHLLIYTNRQEWDQAADEFPKWSKAGGVVLMGLMRRRMEEKALFLA